MSQDGGRT